MMRSRLTLLVFAVAALAATQDDRRVRIVLLGTGTPNATPGQLVEEVKSTFSGRVIYGKDLDVFDLADIKKR